jgi:tRNA G18 (ribose-2'-O)-methylase SpoU
MGPEKSSINNQFIKKSDKLLSIPLHGKVDSLNLSVATAIILYEALNQRKFS